MATGTENKTQGNGIVTGKVSAKKNLGVIRDIGTHFAQSGNHFIAFNLETCDKCGMLAQAANAINVHESKARLLGFGMTFLETIPMELVYDEEHNVCVCESCARLIRTRDDVMGESDAEGRAGVQ